MLAQNNRKRKCKRKSIQTPLRLVLAIYSSAWDLSSSETPLKKPIFFLSKFMSIADSFFGWGGAHAHFPSQHVGPVCLEPADLVHAASLCNSYVCPSCCVCVFVTTYCRRKLLLWWLREVLVCEYIRMSPGVIFLVSPRPMA